MKNYSNKRAKSFLKKLLKKCKDPEIFSVMQTVKEMGADYDKLLEDIELDQELDETFNECHYYCRNNLTKAFNAKEISKEEIIPLFNEVSDRAHKHQYRTDEKYKKECDDWDKDTKRYDRKRFIEKLELQGRELPPDKKEMNRMIKSKPKEQVEKSKLKNVEQKYTDIEKKRIQKWEEKLKKEKSSFKYISSKNKDGRVHIEPDMKDINLPALKMHKLLQSSICAATGSASMDYSILILNQATNGMFTTEENNTSTFNAIYEALLALKPQDEIEGMLCSKLIVLHNQYMEFMGRTSITDQTNAGIDMNINRSTKLMRLFNETLDALNKYRRKGEQKVTVQHVNVNSGGQAIVGSKITNKGGGVNDKK